MGYSSRSVAYRVLNKRTRVIEESFDIEFDDQYQWRKKNQDILYKLQKDAEVVHSPDAIQQLILASGPSTSSEPTTSDNQTDLPINTLTVEGEPSLPSPNHQTQKEPSHPATSEGSLDSLHMLMGYLNPRGTIKPQEIPPDENTSAEESQIQNTTPEDTNFIQNVSPPISDPAHLPRLHKWTRSHPPNQIIGDPLSKVQTRSKK
ncbi:hypothetical protein L2E82_48948 [Cichorium intybus]|uniref:Uncharacterized protein n=1 Tax=Cichorium intybus TaxID=13427 RepID=A0ACB8YZ78_CICIN|nr:hypothetical protein L2E82_48948 [Cichorium intybus]